MKKRIWLALTISLLVIGVGGMLHDKIAQPETSAASATVVVEPPATLPKTLAGINHLVNAERAKKGLSPLTLKDGLNKSATDKAVHMTSNNYFEHNTPDGDRFFKFITAQGVIYEKAAENLAKCNDTPELAVKAWANSPAHYKAMTNPEYTHFGFGYSEWKSGCLAIVTHFIKS